MSADMQKRDSGKVADRSGFVGQDGINLIATIVGKMRHLWTPTTAQSDKGIDGYIELCRDEEDGKRVATNFIIQVQSKATDGPWPHEDDAGFIYKVDERDLYHWLAGNDPVILIVSRPRTNEAYWIPVKDYFSSLEAKKTRTIYFKKLLHRFDNEADIALQGLAIPASIGLKAEPVKKQESLDSNLLPILNHPEVIYVAKTRFKSLDSIRERARTLGASPGREWFYKAGEIISFRPFDKHPWPNLIYGNPLDPIQSATWANSDDLSKRRDFVRLLNEALAAFLSVRGLWRFKFQRRKVLYYFAPDKERIERTEKWGARNTDRAVVQKVLAKRDPTRVVCYRHHAIIPAFERFDRTWHLVFEPTYHFTVDGEKAYSFREIYLSGIKRIEKHQAVRNNVRFCAHFLTYCDLFDQRKDLLAFGPPLAFTTDFGVPDADWLSNADAEERECLGPDETDKRESLVADGDQLLLTYEA